MTALRDVRVEGSALLLDGTEVRHEGRQAHGGLDITAFYAAKDGRTIITADSRGGIRIWDIEEKGKQLGSCGVPGVVKHIAIAPDRSILFVVHRWSLWGLCFDAFVMNNGEPKMLIHTLRLDDFKGRIEFGKDAADAVLWLDPEERRWRLTLKEGPGLPTAAW